jgi:hypothetical protein
MIRCARSLITTTLAILSTSVFANDHLRDPPLIQIGGGYFNVLRYKRCGQVQIEYKWSPVVYTLRPFVGVTGTVHQSGYLYGGIGLDLFIGKYFVLTPSFAPGLYYRGHGKNLGYPLEFRSSIEAAVIFKKNYRLGVQFYHISNASLGHKNPGEESLIFFLAIPITL